MPKRFGLMGVGAVGEIEEALGLIGVGAVGEFAAFGLIGVGAVGAANEEDAEEITVRAATRTALRTMLFDMEKSP